jgi:hypothetical protein
MVMAEGGARLEDDLVILGDDVLARVIAAE